MKTSRRPEAVCAYTYQYLLDIHSYQGVCAPAYNKWRDCCFDAMKHIINVKYIMGILWMRLLYFDCESLCMIRTGIIICYYINFKEEL